MSSVSQDVRLTAVVTLIILGIGCLHSGASVPVVSVSDATGQLEVHVFDTSSREYVNGTYDIHSKERAEWHSITSTTATGPRSLSPGEYRVRLTAIHCGGQVCRLSQLFPKVLVVVLADRTVATTIEVDVPTLHCPGCGDDV